MLILVALIGLGLLTETLGAAASFAASLEEKQFAQAQKMLETGEEWKFRPLASKWIESPESKLKARWLELFVRFQLFYGHKPDVPKIEIATQLAPRDAQILATYALTQLLERHGRESIKASDAALNLAPGDKRVVSIAKFCKFCYGGSSPPSSAEVLRLVNAAGMQLDTYCAAEHYFLLRYDRVNQREVWNTLVKNNPNSSYSYFRRGLFDRRTSDRDYGANDFKKAIELSPASDEAARNLAQALFNARKYDECLKAYDRMERMGMMFAEALSQRGISNMQLQRFDKAIVDFTRVLSMHGISGTNIQQLKNAKAQPRTSQSMIYIWLCKRADCYRELKQFEKALADLRFATILMPAELKSLELKGKVHRDQNKIDVAINDLNQLLKSRPQSPNYFRERAALLYKINRKADAEKDIAEAKRIEATSPAAKIINAELQ